MPTLSTAHSVIRRAASVPGHSCTRKWAYVLLCGLSLGLSTMTALAEELSVDEMACALDPQCSRPFVDRRLRGVTATPSVRTPGSFDRTVNFAFDSADLTPDARKELDTVADALRRPNTGTLEIVISGHTDGIGTPEYNQKLSERRAEAARQYLITQHGIDGNRLAAKGLGKSELLLPTDPSNELNRRVSFQNPKYGAASSSQGCATPSTPTSSKPASAGGDGL